jgi:hypothetical protein
MKKNQDMYEFLKDVNVPRYKNDSLQQRLKHRLYKIMDQDDTAAEKSRGFMRRHGFALVFAGSGLVCALILAFVLVFAPGSAFPVLTASLLCGDVNAVYDQKPVALKVGEKLDPGVTITVAEGSSCDVSLNKTSLLRFGERSTITLDKMDNTITVRLVQGMMIGHIRKHDRPLNLWLVTDNCIIGIKSTTFLVKADQDRVTRIALLEGRLSIKTNSAVTDKEYILQSGRELELTLDSTEISTTPLSDEHRAVLLQVKGDELAVSAQGRRTVTCEIQTVPADATIYINGQKKGKGKLAFLAEKDRAIRLKVTHSDYEVHESTVEIHENKTLRIMLNKKQAIEDEDTGTATPHGGEGLEAHEEGGGEKTVSLLKGGVIFIDGKFNDWQFLRPVVHDPKADIGLDLPEADITQLLLAKNNDTFFACIKFAGGKISDLSAIEYRVDIMEQGKRLLSIIILYTERRLRIILAETGVDDTETGSSAGGAAAGGRGIVEASFALAIINKYLVQGKLYSCRVTSRIPKDQADAVIIDETVIQEFIF